MKKLLFLCLLLIISCSKKEQADLIVTNANIYTVDSLFSKAEAFAVKGGKFLAVGTSEEILSKYQSVEMLDAGGKTILPGLIDAHCHFYGLGLNQQRVDLVGTKSFEEVVRRTVAFQQENNMPFILGRGWDQNDWDIKEFPNKKKLDSLFPETPVALERVDGHAYLVNQKALDLAGITAKTIVPGGEVEVINGKTTGILVDAPMGLVDAIMPPPDRKTQIEALADAEKICFSYGLTTLSDAGLDRKVIELIDSLQQTGLLNMRVYAMVSNTQENLDYFLPKGIIKTDKLNVRSVKVYGDGALGSRGAALREPYTDKPGHYGAMITPADELLPLAERIAASGYQMNTHAIGDSANTSVLKTYEKVLKGKTDQRWRVEHAQIVSMDDFDYFSRNIIPSVQPTHATSDMYWAKDRVGAERIQGGYANKTLLEKAGLVALGTDFPVEQVSPFLTFYAAVARQDQQGFPEGGYQMKDALSREETLKGMTIWAAVANFEENEKGSIAPGKLADFVIIDSDIMSVPINEVPKTNVEKTFLGGKQVY